MKNGVTRAFWVCLCLALTPGCSSLQVREFPSCRNGLAKKGVPVYPSTVADAVGVIHGGHFFGDYGDLSDYLIWSPVFLLDLPFSIMADTLLLPVDIYRNLQKDPRSKESEPARSPYSEPTTRSPRR
jgi:uncharacterized protein YceK